MSKLNKNLKILIFSAIGLLVLAGVVTLLLLTQPKTETTDTTETEEETVDESLVFTSSETTAITKLHIKNSEDEYDLVQTDGVWSCPQIDGAPLSDSFFTSTAGYAAEITAKQLVEAEPEDLTKYGLDTPSATVTIELTDKEPVTLLIGDEAPTGSATYFMAEGNPAVYICNTYRFANYYYTRYKYISTALMADYDTDNVPVINKITIDRYDLEEPMIIEALPTTDENDAVQTYSSHKFVQPYDVLIDSTDGTSVLYGMYGLSASEAVWVGMDQADYELSGLDKPNMTVTMRVGGKDYTLKVGKASVLTSTDENGKETQTVKGYYAMISEIPDVLYLIAPENLPWLTLQVEDIMARLFMTPYIYSLDKFTYEAGDTKLEFRVDGDSDEHTFFCNDEAVEDESRVKTLYQFFISAYGEEIYMDETDTALIARLTYTYDDGSEPDVVEFRESDDRKIIVNVNGKNLYKCRQLYATRLLENVEAYLSGGEIVTDW